MEELKSRALMLLFISAGAFVFFHLLPAGNLSKSAKSVIAVLCMATVLIPIFRLFDEGPTRVREPAYPDVTDTGALYGYYVSSAKRTVEDTVDGVMRKFGVNSYVLEARTDITADGCIDIKQVLITLETKPENLNDIAIALKEALGIAAQIEVK